MPRSRDRTHTGLLRRIDRMSVRTHADYWRHIPPELTPRLRPRIGRVGDALMTLSATSDSLRMNRVTGFGSLGRARETMVDEMIAFYRAAKLHRFSVMLGPGAQSRRITGWLERRGFIRRAGHTLLARACAVPVPPTPSGVRVARARRGDTEHILDIYARTFPSPESRRSWPRAAILAGDNEHYLGFVGRSAVGVGALRAIGGLAWLGGGATLTPWRRRGVHRALILARLARAARLGCRWTWVETAAPAPGRPQGSYRNLLRVGFAVAGTKPVYVWSGG